MITLEDLALELIAGFLKWFCISLIFVMVFKACI